MNNFLFEETKISGAYIVSSFYAEDNRGSFIKSFEKDVFKNNIISFEPNEVFISHSIKNVVRGMHFQLYHPQTKLVGVISGKVYDVIVDLRKDSPTFREWLGMYLSDSNRTSLLIPKGCAHGFMSLSDDSVVSYICEGKYDKDTDSGIIYNDVDIAINWPINDMSNVILGDRDKELMSFKEFESNCQFVY